eukprot:g18826.t1
MFICPFQIFMSGTTILTWDPFRDVEGSQELGLEQGSELLLPRGPNIFVESGLIQDFEVPTKDPPAVDPGDGDEAGLCPTGDLGPPSTLDSREGSGVGGDHLVEDGASVVNTAELDQVEGDMVFMDDDPSSPLGSSR